MSRGNGVLIMAGGTGGHIFPGLAVASALRSEDIPVRWLGAAGGMECSKVPPAGLPIDVVNIKGLRGKGLAGWLSLPFRLLRAVWQAFRLIGQNRPACAISFGGYAAGPGGLAAKIRGVPLLVHEQNRIPGMTNRNLARMSTRVLEAFPDTWPEKLNAKTCGNPVRSDLTELAEPAYRLTGRSGPVRILLTGGSQGAMNLNRLMTAAVSQMANKEQFEIRHQCGPRWVEETREAYQEMGFDAEVTAFIEDMAEAYEWADLAVCRSGALTVSELAAVGMGALLVPFPFAVDDHQTANAEVLEQAGAARILQERDAHPGAMAGLLSELVEDRGLLLQMAANARAQAVPDSAEQVARLCREIMA